MSRLKGLGKGLEALLSAEVNPAFSSVETGLKELPLDLLQPGSYQPRQIFNEQELEELALSIKQQGVIQPVIVRALGDGGR